MAKSTDERIKQLYKLLSSNKGYSTEQLQNELNISNRKTIASYINKLKKQGINIVSRSRKYYIEDDNDFLIPMNINSYYKFLILNQISRGYYSEKQLFDSFHESINDDIDYDLIDISFSTFNNLINEMISDHTLERVEEKLIPTGKQYSIEYILNENDFNILYNNTRVIPVTHPFYKQLVEVNSLIDQYFYNTTDEKTHDYYLSYGRTRTRYNDETTLDTLKKLLNLNYRTHALHIKYRSSKGVKDVVVDVGLIFFSIEKDKYYIMCKKHDDTFMLLINVSTIICMENTDMKQYIFNSERYINLFNRMLGITIEEEFDVLVEFDNQPFIINKLQVIINNLSSKALVLEKMDNKVILSGRISGMGDFKRIIRTFGSSCRVIKPEVLKEDMISSTNKSLERYKVDYE